MKNILERANYVVKGEEGASNIEIIVWISVVLVIAIALWFFRDKIVEFLGKSSDKVSNFRVE